MSIAGFVYVLINPSMEGMVKIGKTNRDPHQRAKELSATTGVPTPFMSVYDEFFDNCSEAEDFVHTLLERNGHRVSDNREFFQIAVKDAIAAVMEAKVNLYSGERGGDLNESEVQTEVSSQNCLWMEVFEQAEEARYGLNDAFKDIGAAIKLY